MKKNNYIQPVVETIHLIGGIMMTQSESNPWQDTINKGGTSIETPDY